MFAVAITATELKMAAPQAYDVFIEALKKLEERCMADLLAAGESGIMGAQARANLIRELRTKLETCFQVRSLAEKRKP